MTEAIIAFLIVNSSLGRFSKAASWKIISPQFSIPPAPKSGTATKSKLIQTDTNIQKSYPKYFCKKKAQIILMLTLAQHPFEGHIAVLLCGITATLANDHWNFILSCFLPIMPFFRKPHNSHNAQMWNVSATYKCSEWKCRLEENIFTAGCQKSSSVRFSCVWVR